MMLLNSRWVILGFDEEEVGMDGPMALEYIYRFIGSGRYSYQDQDCIS